ncbi:hypothetical protein VKI22_07400 [Cyanobacterium aponinum UTEX 3221]|uniref:hypothetical protein n=1 Tax=Cyanobacterium aponinum TaxID=379064 RepID=UPI001680C586|nr:hypothetical protein [Cyanobacterium aponinum]MBD2393942.1 hypothetical protein [Cyanobacterium aponinum FACHB-4101]WRL39896.1 hypothetical protein VKI22_07400 [Cyanobacterium aponinum UTEX 3221]
MNKADQNMPEVTEAQIERLYQLKIYLRWILVVCAWILILPWSLWQFRETISLCQERCTWAVIRVGIEFTPLGALGIAFCMGFTTSVLVWQSLHILRGGLSNKEKYYLRQEMVKILQQGEKHWLYRYFH